MENELLFASILTHDSKLSGRSFVFLEKLENYLKICEIFVILNKDISKKTEVSVTLNFALRLLELITKTMTISCHSMKSFSKEKFEIR